MSAEKQQQFNAFLPEGLTYIGDSAFLGTNIKQITIPTTLESIGGAYKGYYQGPFGGALTSAVFTTGRKTIPSNIFAGNTALKTVSIPKGVDKTLDFSQPKH